MLTVDKYRKALTRLRVSSHILLIETGRWNKPSTIPRNERLCPFCEVLEDEYHFVLECQLFNNLRKNYVPKFYRVNPSMHKFIELWSSGNSEVIKNMSVYVYKAFECRSSDLYQKNNITTT